MIIVAYLVWIAHYMAMTVSEIPQWVLARAPKAFFSWSDDQKIAYCIKRKSQNVANATRYAHKNRESFMIKHRENNAVYREKHRDRLRVILRKRAREYYHNNLEKSRAKARQSMKHMRETDKGYLAKQNISRRIRHLIKHAGSIKKDSTLVYVGCSTVELRLYLESLMESWMSWENYGTHWEIDHIIPCSAFDHTDDNQVKQCWHYANLRPLSIFENRSKHAKIRHPQMSLRMPMS